MHVCEGLAVKEVVWGEALQIVFADASPNAREQQQKLFNQVCGLVVEGRSQSPDVWGSNVYTFGFWFLAQTCLFIVTGDSVKPELILELAFHTLIILDFGMKYPELNVHFLDAAFAVAGRALILVSLMDLELCVEKKGIILVPELLQNLIVF